MRGKCRLCVPQLQQRKVLLVSSGEGRQAGLAPWPRTVSCQVPLSHRNAGPGFEGRLASYVSEALWWTAFCLSSCKPVDSNFCKCIGMFASSSAGECISCWQGIRAGPSSVWGEQKGRHQLLFSGGTRSFSCLGPLSSAP